MTLPLGRNETLVPAVSQFASATGNDMQDWLARLYSGQARADGTVADDFLGGNVNLNLWTALGTGVTIYTAAILPGAQGVASFDPTVGGTAGLTTQSMAMGLLDFHITCICYAPNYATAANMTWAMGLLNIFDVNESAFFQFQRTAGATQNVKCRYDAQSAGFDTLIPVPVNGFAVYEIKRTGFKLEFFINGQVVHSTTTYSRSLTAAALQLLSSQNSAAGLVYADLAKLRVGRGFSTTGSVSAGTTGHMEQGFATFAEGGAGAGFDYVDVAFANAFADTNYNHNPPIELTDGSGEAPGGALFITNKAVGGMRINVGAQFGGKVRWQAWT